MTTRPEYVHCVESDPVFNNGKPSWCGQEYRPFFTTIEHAALNGLSGGRLLTCPQCIAVIVKALKGTK
jgi:hypothetical protein